MTAVARRLLLPLASVSFLAAAWTSQMVILDSALFDLTPGKLLLLVAGVAFLAARPWQLRPALDRRLLAALMLFTVSLVLLTLVRGPIDELKRVAGAVLFGSIAFAITYWGAAASKGERLNRMLALTLAVFACVSFAGALLEILVYPGPGGAALADLWRPFRGQPHFFDPSVAPGADFVAHWFGASRELRVAGFSWHPNTLGLSMLVPAAFAVALFTSALRASSPRLGSVALGLLALTCATVIVSASRAALVGLLAVLFLSAVVDWYMAQRTQPGRRPAWRHAAASARAPLVGVVLIAALLLAQGTALARLGGTLAPPPTTGPGVSVPTVGAEAAEGTDIRLGMVMAGIDLLLETPATLLAGPGLAAYARTISDPASRHYLPEVIGTSDPNSFWLTIALAGGAVAALAILSALGWLWLRLWRQLRARATSSAVAGSAARLGSAPRVDLSAVHLLWLVSWLPAWAVIQNLGSMPFQVGIAVPFGFVLGIAAAYAGRRDEA